MARARGGQFNGVWTQGYGATSRGVVSVTTVPDGVILEAQLVPGSWTDLLPDVIAEDHIRWSRGILGSSPLDRVASTGTLEFTLRNDALNSGGTLGWYSPHHGSVRAGWTFGIPCRLSYRASNVVKPLWHGKVRTILPTPGVSGDRRVLVTAQDGMGDLAQSRIREVSAQFDQSETELLTVLFAALPAAALPPAVVMDPGLDTYPFAFDDLGSGGNGLAATTTVVLSALGKFYTSADGTWRYRNRQTLALETSQLTLADATLSAVGGDFNVPSSMANVYNRVRVTVHPKTLGASATTVIYASSSPVHVTAGATVTVWGTYTDPDNTLQTVGGKDFQTLTAYTDYEANNTITGVGTDLTAGMVITADPFGSSVKFTIQNTNGEEVWLVKAADGSPHLQLRGRPIYDLAPLTAEAGSTEDFGERLLELDLPYQDDANVAQDMADYLHTQYQQLSLQVDAITINPQRIGMASCLDLDIGDVVTVSETVTGLTSANVVIQAISGEIQPTKAGGYMFMTLRTAPILAEELWILDDPVRSILDDTTILAWG